MPKDLSAQQVGLQGRSRATEPKSRVFTGRSDFPMSYDFPNTYRYGEVAPFYYQHTVGDDDIPLFSEHQLSTYTLSSPIKSKVTMNKSYFLVDYKAIYPRNWDLMLVSPNKGDDVPADTKLVVSNLIKSFYLRLYKFKAYDGEFTDGVATDFMRFVFLMESVFSHGSLFSEFNIHLSPFVKCYTPDDPQRLDPKSFDTWFDTFFVPIIADDTNFRVTINGDSYAVSPFSNPVYNSDNDTYYVSVRRLLELMRANSFTVRSLDSQLVDDALSSLSMISVDVYPLNLDVIAAYQLGCAQFFTDSNIDFVYSAALYRDALDQIFRKVFTSYSSYEFTYNGGKRLYDVLSGSCMTKMLNSLSSSDLGVSYLSSVYDWFVMLFGHRNSLRFGDYFVSGRVSPYGTGDLTVNTSGSSVSVVDITRKIQLQRFWNKVNIAGQKIGEYARGVLGLSNADDNSYDIPAYLGHKNLPIGSIEVENTGDGQRAANNITTVLRASQNVHAFDIHTKRPGIIIGVMSFDIPRIYSRTIDRMHMHQNRFDDYIPEMQFVGDQQIYQRELDSTKPVNGIFAYSLRYMEYKMRYNYAAGGAIEALKTWYFVTDNKDGNPLSRNIDPDYIRSQPSEFDRFYSSLTGYSLGTYFHFNVMNRNYQKLTRDMVLAPEPLK